MYMENEIENLLLTSFDVDLNMIYPMHQLHCGFAFCYKIIFLNPKLLF